MKERPILFSAPMVRALLDGSKTQTRRVVKPKSMELLEWFGGKSDADDDRELDELLGQRNEEKGLRVWCADYPDEESEVIKSPYGQPGDRLWVREAWCGEIDGDTSQLIYNEDGNTYKCLYRADGQHVVLDDGDGFAKTRKDGSEASPWKPSIHMPRWASRITLEITSVRVERLQDISHADALTEGCTANGIVDGAYASNNARGAYAHLWTQINGPGSWDANPWVWVVEFKRVAP